MKQGKKFYKGPSLTAAVTLLLLALLTAPTGLVLTAAEEKAPLGSTVRRVRTASAVQATKPPATIQAAGGFSSTGEQKIAAEAGKPSVERWIVMPVTTELQRITAGRDARAYVFVNGEAFRQNRVTLDGKALDLDGLGEQLKPYADPEKATVHFYIRCVQGESHLVQDGRSVTTMEGSPDKPLPKDYVTFLLRWALIGFGKDAGFRDASAEIIYRLDPSESWEALVADLKKGLAEDAGRKELGIGNEKFKVYPVQTALSRFMYWNADCLLHVELGVEIGAKELKAIEEAVDKLNLKDRRKIFFHLPTRLLRAFFNRDAVWKGRLGFRDMVLKLGYRPLRSVQ